MKLQVLKVCIVADYFVTEVCCVFLTFCFIKVTCLTSAIFADVDCGHCTYTTI